METVAVVLRNPGALALERVGCLPAGAEDVLVETAYSGISTGTEKLLWSGRMPPFPGMGYPLVPGYETARHLGVPAVWVEREGGEMRLRRFELPEGARVVVVEDIVTTGLSSRETIAALEALGAKVVACACLIDRSDGEAEVGVPLIALAGFKVPAYPADQLPPELAALPPVKPGSRNLA